MNDEFWKGLRYVLIFAGGFLAGRGIIKEADVGPLADSIVQLGSAAVSLATMIWGFYVSNKTKMVPKTDLVPGQQVVSPATGRAEPHSDAI